MWGQELETRDGEGTVGGGGEPKRNKKKAHVTLETTRTMSQKELSEEEEELLVQLVSCKLPAEARSGSQVKQFI